MKNDNGNTDDCQKQGSRAPEYSLEEIVEREAQLRAKSGLIDTMIYHIRTLSNAVIGFSDLLMTESLNDDLLEYVKEIHDAGFGLSVLVNEVLDWTQLLSGNLKITKTKFRVSDLLYDIHELLSIAARKKGLDYEIVTDPDMPAHLYTDKERLLKCLINVTASAIKHTPEGAVRLYVKVEPSATGPFVCFKIVDTGVGIEPEKLSKIFLPTIYRIEMDEEILSQLDKGLTVTAGLPLTRQLCELMGGTIEAQSQVGQGATFTMRIPAGVEIASEPRLGSLSWEQDTSAEVQPEAEESQPRTVLLVEDQQSNRTVISLMLEALGVRVDAVEGGRDALEKVRDSVYDLILMDLKMPDMDGYETTHQLREAGVTAPVIALSAKVVDEKEYSHIADLFDGFLGKPVDHNKLSEMLEKFFPTANKSEVTEHATSENVISLEYGT